MSAYPGDFYCTSCCRQRHLLMRYLAVSFLPLVIVIIVLFLPLADGAGKSSSTKTFTGVLGQFRTHVEGGVDHDKSPAADDHTASSSSMVENLAVQATIANNKERPKTMLRSGIAQHAVIVSAASNSGGSSNTNSDSPPLTVSSSSQTANSQARDRQGSSTDAEIKMAATHGKGRGSASLAPLPIKGSHSGDNTLFYGPVPGVDPDKYSMLFNRSSEEMKIKRALLYSGVYDKTSRPVTQDRDNVTVHIGISLYHILDTNEKYQTISLLIAVRLKWRDAMLRWDPREYNGVDQIWLPSDLLWTPDIVINNNADHEVKMQTNAIVESSGDILWMYPQLAKIYCTLDVRNFPFDVQHCDIKFFSWTYNGYQIDLMTTESENPSYFDEANQEWNVISIRGKRNVAIYACCPEPFPDISFTLIMKRRSMFYIFNLIFPCMLIYAVAFLGFFLPIESNEKINLEVTILLALVVFLMVIGETMPPSPDAIPLLGMLYASTMMMVSIALVSAVAVTNVYYKEKYGEQVPRWLFRLLYWNADLPCPKCRMPQRMLRSAQFDKATGMASKKPFKNASFMMAPSAERQCTDCGLEMMPTSSHQLNKSTDPNHPGANDTLYISRSPTNRRVAWMKSCSCNAGSLPNTEQSALIDVATPLNPGVSMGSDDEQFTNTPNGNKKRTGADSPVWKHRSNGAPGGAFDIWSPPDCNQIYCQQPQPQFYRSPCQHPHYQEMQPITSNHLFKAPVGGRSATYVRQLSESGHSTRFVRTDAGCVHITISWREIAERIDGILFWAFLVSSIVVFTLIFVTVDYEDPVPSK